MKKLLKNFVPVFLFVGILAGCETTDPLIEEAQKNIFLENFDGAIALLDQSIAANPESGVPYYYKAWAYYQNALVVEDPNARKPFYRDFRESVDTARIKFAAQEEKPEEAGQVNNLILDAWGTEHNAAIEYVNNDSVMATTEEPYEFAAAHLENAIIINPDSALSYDILAQVYALNDQTEKAIEAQEKAMELQSPPPSITFRRLAHYYNVSNQADKSIATLQEGLVLYPDSIALSQRLADAYMKNGQRDSSIAVIEQLIENEPENAQYHLALGTQLLQATTNLSDQISENYDKIYELNRAGDSEDEIAQLEEENRTLQTEIDELSNYAEQELLQVIEARPEQESAYNALGILYKNRAAALFELRNYAIDDNEKAAEYDRRAKEALREAMKHYEKVVELNPKQRGAWQDLSNIYITLDMNKKAEEALEKAGL